MPDKVTTVFEGVSTDFFPQSYTDEAVTAALANVSAAPEVTPEAVEVDLILTDGSLKKFVPAS